MNSQRAFTPELRTIIRDPLAMAYLLGYDKVKHSIHREWIREMWRPGNSTLMAHRNSYKTTSRVIGIIWGLLVFPDTRILIIRKSMDEAAKTVGEIMQHYERPALRALYQDLYGVSEPRDLDKWSQSKGIALSTKIEVTKERSVEPTGVGKHKTGSHYDLIIGDDIVTLADRQSVAEREATKDFIKELHNILNVDGIGLKLSGTPWHEDDAYSTAPEPKRYPVTMNFIEDMTDEKLKAIRKKIGDESLYQANYHLIHVATEDRLFAEPKFAPVPENFQPYAYLDPAFGDKKTNDYCGLSIAGQHEDKIMVSGGYIWRTKLDKTYDAVVRYCHHHNVSILFVEDNQAQVAVAVELVERGLTVRTVTALKSKHQRIQHYCGKMWDSIVFAHDLDGTPYLRQILDYVDPQYSAHDDAPDSLAGVIQCLTGAPRKAELGYFQL